MLARNLMERIPQVRRTTTCAEAARIMAEYRMMGLVLVDDDHTVGVIDVDDVLAALIPDYLKDQPQLAHVLDEKGADHFAERLTSLTVGDLLELEDVDAVEPAIVAPDDTIVEIVAAMLSSQVQIIGVKDGDTYVGAIVMSRVLAALARLAGQDSERLTNRLTRDLMHPEDVEPADEARS